MSQSGFKHWTSRSQNKKILTALTTELTRHTILVTLTEYITLETDAGLKRKIFGMSDRRDLGQLTQLQSSLRYSLMCKHSLIMTSLSHSFLLNLSPHIPFVSWNPNGPLNLS
jgi:hypothetical protein